MNHHLSRLNAKVENLKRKIEKVEGQDSSEIENDYVSGQSEEVHSHMEQVSEEEEV